MSSKLTEKKLLRRDALAFSADGTTTGIISVDGACNFKVKQCVTIQSATQPPRNLEIKRFIDGSSFYVGEVGQPISQRSDVSAYTLADAAFIFAQEQNRPSVPEQEIERITYEEEPVIARRVVIVDDCGEIITQDNPLPTTATLNLGSIEIPVEIDAQDGDNVAISAHPDPIFAQNEDSLTDLLPKSVFSYTSTNSNTRVIALNVTADTPVMLKVLLNGIEIRRHFTSPMERNAHIVFEENRPIPTGTTISVVAQLFRQFCPSYSVFTSMEGYLT